jgi:hypothetical protein
MKKIKMMKIKKEYKNMVVGCTLEVEVKLMVK